MGRPAHHEDKCGKDENVGEAPPTPERGGLWDWQFCGRQRVDTWSHRLILHASHRSVLLRGWEGEQSTLVHYAHAFFNADDKTVLIAAILQCQRFFDILNSNFR
jgi:hypothetical protein